ncbi:MAG: hypothetical protein NVS9B4_08790 [Candidatus Acidiferrum sp.]
MNALYWRDVASQSKAYVLSLSWRILELIEHAIIALQADGVLAPAILSRSLVELTTTFIVNGSRIRLAVEVASKRWDKEMVACEELESILNKALYGTRQVEKDDYRSQTNILSFIEKLSKNEGFERVLDQYNLLCEVAHPNVVGNARFWSDKPEADADGTTLRELNPNPGNTQICLRLLDVTLWSIAWSAANAMNGFAIIDSQIGIISRAFPEPTDMPTGRVKSRISAN